MIKGHSNILGAVWFFLPGCVAELRMEGKVLGAVRSPAIGEHISLPVGGVHSSLHDAQKAVERYAKG